MPLPGSKLHRQTSGDLTRIHANQLPQLETTDDLLRWLNLDIKSLIALANPTDRIRPNHTNYAEWPIPKRSKGVRIICSPKPRLRAIQRRIKNEILDKVAIHDAGHGFIRDRSILTNASPHVSQPLIVNLDLRRFFEHVRYPRVVGVFRRIGYSLEISRWLAMLCTHRPNMCWAHDMPILGCFVHRPFRYAVQGAPTSPAIANLSVHRLDCRLTGLARRFNATYTRYADDLTFSGGEDFKRGMKRFIPLVTRIIKEEKFMLNEKKMRFMRPGQRQQVTGVIVNRKPNVRRDEYDRIKAILHNARRSGLASQNRDNRPNFRAYLLGMIAQFQQINPQRGNKLKLQLSKIA